MPAFRYFKCPGCHNQMARLKEVVVNATVSTTIDSIGEGCDVRYLHDASTDSDAYLTRYQCVDCGYVVPQISDHHDLYLWLCSGHGVMPTPDS